MSRIQGRQVTGRAKWTTLQTVAYLLTCSTASLYSEGLQYATVPREAMSREKSTSGYRLALFCPVHPKVSAISPHSTPAAL